MAELKELAISEQSWVAERAQIAVDLQQQYANNEISKDEYQELMEDLARSDQLNDQADGQDLKNTLVSAIMIAAKLV